jgi:hypothetical protein
MIGTPAELLARGLRAYKPVSSVEGHNEQKPLSITNSVASLPAARSHDSHCLSQCRFP